MRAVGIYEFGGPEQLQVLDLSEPHPGPGQIRIRVHAAGVNPADTVIRAGRRGRPEWDPPYVLGMDAAGVIDEVGPGASWRAGVRVMVATAQGTMAVGGGSYADWVVVAAEAAAAIPSGLHFTDAATLPMNGLTARDIVDRLDLQPGATIAVIGAAGAVGAYVIQLAKAERLRVIADAADNDEVLVRSFGADEVVRRGPEVAERIREVEPNGVDALVDAAVLGEAVVPAIRTGGRLAVVRPWEGPEPGRGISVLRARVDLRLTDGDALDRLRQQVDKGVLSPLRTRAMAPEQAAEAHRLLAAGGLRERLILDFSL
ncbi:MULTISPECIES: NADP-dependent oxidoreductase [Nocardia]|uniref:NADP-dependent oxidoreductase n=1 Tax=Nocardia TaxID=1817 RepID=UPI00058550D4|nr:NADP-dependent oxidoreductase [Nocardia araoensis]